MIISIKKFAPVLIGIFFFIVCANYIVHTFQWAEIVTILLNANLIWLLVAGSFAIILFWIFRSLRWYVLLKASGVHVNFLDLYFCTSVSLTISTLTPLQSGEMLKIEFLRRYSLMDRSVGYSSFLLERIMDVSAVSLLALAGTLSRYYFGVDQASIWIVLIGLVIFLCLGIFVVTKINVRSKILDSFKQMLLSAHDGKTLSLLILLTFCSWVTVAFGWQVCLYSISIQISLEKMLFMAATLSIINVMSFIPGALGIFEVGTTEFLLSFGNSAALAQTGAVILRAQLLVIIVLGVIHLVLGKIFTSVRVVKSGTLNNRPD